MGPGTGACYIKSAGSVISGNLHWDDWTQVTQNYDLHLYRWDPGPNIMYRMASSKNLQSGGAGQTPTESVFYVAPVTGCYAWVVEKVKADRNVCFRLITPNSSIRMGRSVFGPQTPTSAPSFRRPKIFDRATL